MKKYIVLAHGFRKKTLPEAKKEIKDLKEKDGLPYKYYIYELRKIGDVTSDKPKDVKK